MALEQELATFRQELPALLAMPENQGKYALVFRDKVDSIWPTVDEGLTAGYDRFGLDPFLVKRITAHETPLYCSRNPTRCR
ncbi:MAG TPA: hypothetical protein VKA46_16175 [Gemmataceae bacterium]|nr:hypothetical protein [Gemmataceae bacterium]